MKRVLIVNVNWLGDTLFATPFIRALKESCGDCYIAVLSHPRCREILEGNHCIDEIIAYDEKGHDRHIAAKLSIIARLRARKFDTAFILRKSLSRTILLFLSGIPERIGYANKKSGFLLTRKIFPPSGDLHRVEYFLGLARGVGIEPGSVKYEFFISEKDKHKGDRILREEGLKTGEGFVVINPGGNWDLKRWPAESFAKLADEIFNRFNVKVVLTGAKKDIDLCKKISGLTKIKPVLLCGKTDLKTLGAIFKKAKWVISNDSGPMHIAIAVKAPLIALFGPTTPLITGPYGEGAYMILQKDVGCEIPCYFLACKDNKCMKAITVEDVLKLME